MGSYPRNAALDQLSLSDRDFFNKYSFGKSLQSPFPCVHHAFEFHALSYPHLLAVDNLGDTMTYAELDRQANCLARQLRDAGVGPGSRICLLVERSIFMVVGIVAVLKSGAAYVPLDGNIVADSTLAHVLRDSESSLVLTLRKYLPRVPNHQTICLEDAVCQISSGHCTKPVDLSNSRDSAYIVYTSGTTGVPKGVEVMHGNVTNLVCLEPGNIEMRPGARVSQLMNIAFDMAAWEILGGLSNGCTICLRGKSSKEWRATMKTVDIVIATPSMLVPHEPSDYPNIKAVAVAGEVCPQPLADKWASSGHFYNSCGPTEITIVNTVHPHVVGHPLSIGKPTPNNNVYVLGDNLEPLPIGKTGLMWAGGAGITKGYVNLPEKTEERYKLDPFMDDGSYMFNTGDLGRWREDGSLEHLGRIDDQVKIKGFRVELDGVSAAMETCTGVKNAAALLIGDTLWGFYTPSTVEIKEVEAAVAKIQPYYAVPSRFIKMDMFPNTANEKTDKRELRRLALEALESTEKAIVEKVVISSSEKEKTDLVQTNVEKLLFVQEAISAPPPVYRRHPQSLDLVLAQAAATKPSLSSSSETSSTVEQGLAWAGYEDDEIPEKTQGKYARNLRHQVFTLYRRLFGVVFVVNLGILIATLVKGGANSLELGQIVIANLFCAILMRQDYVINAFFNVFCAVPTSWPLAIRRVCARVYHIGGLHSGCAISGSVWLLFFTVEATRELVRGEQISIATVAITYWILLLILLIIFFAYPTLRTSKHDHFERAHRFLGWSCTALVWAQVILLINDFKAPDQTLGSALVSSPPFWLVVIMTASIILPWIRLRKVPVRAEVLSNHAVRLYFEYVTPVPGTFTRISESPLFEWHGFATVPEPGQKGYSLVVSKAGDWTSKQIADPPKELWVRGIPTCGVLRIVPLFRRVVFVATGSGIGPCAPCILEQRVPIRLLWTSPDVRKTFGDKLVDSILAASPDAVIYDTRKYGKPDMVKLVYRLVREFDAEAVCVISNQKLTRKVVYGMMSRGIPAFGAIWDS
ncbi:putative NRPS-like protein biosynthetic cluster [Pleurotus pulmonarius]|nr:putative NRPS-like protein biosynthetic cluster [Pleurotus pulmonarius]